MSTDSYPNFGSSRSLLFEVYGVLIGPTIFGAYLTISYALVPHACSTGNRYWLHLLTLAALAAIATGLFSSWSVYQRVPAESSIEGGQPQDRARFLAELGIAMSLFSILLVIANAVPRFVLGACDQ